MSIFLSDVDEVKRDVLRLEEKLRTFKTYLRSELTALRISANEIEHEVRNTVSLRVSTALTLIVIPYFLFNKTETILYVNTSLSQSEP